MKHLNNIELITLTGRLVGLSVILPTFTIKQLVTVLSANDWEKLGLLSQIDMERQIMAFIKDIQQ